MSDFSKKVVETQKSAVYVWLGLLLAMTLFYVQSQLVFVHGPARQATVMTVVLFVLGGITYLLASAFFDRYALLKWEDWRQTKFGPFLFSFWPISVFCDHFPENIS